MVRVGKVFTGSVEDDIINKWTTSPVHSGVIRTIYSFKMLKTIQ